MLAVSKLYPYILHQDISISKNVILLRIAKIIIMIMFLVGIAFWHSCSAVVVCWGRILNTYIDYVYNVYSNY